MSLNPNTWRDNTEVVYDSFKNQWRKILMITHQLVQTWLPMTQMSTHVLRHKYCIKGGIILPTFIITLLGGHVSYKRHC